jgi:hypothetical protein
VLPSGAQFTRAIDFPTVYLSLRFWFRRQETLANLLKRKKYIKTSGVEKYYFKNFFFFNFALPMKFTKPLETDLKLVGS